MLIKKNINLQLTINNYYKIVFHGHILKKY